MSRYHPNEHVDSIEESWRRIGTAHDRIDKAEPKKTLGPWLNPTYQNSFGNPGGTYQNFQYRLDKNGRWEPRGVLEMGADGTVAFTLPEPFRPQADEYHVVQTTSGLAIAFIDASTGDVSVSIGEGMLLNVKSAIIQFSTSGDHVVVAGVGSKQIRVISGFLLANGTVDIKWKDETGDLSGYAYLVANAGYVLSRMPEGHFNDAHVGEDLILNSTAAEEVGGVIRYQEITP